MPEDDARQLAVQERQHGLRCGGSEGAGHCRQDEKFDCLNVGILKCGNYCMF